MWVFLVLGQDWQNKNRDKLVMNWIKKLLGTPLDKNPIDTVIIEKLPGADNEQVQEVYQARWVWYHTILAVELAFTNILLLGILIVLAFK
jgi:hypothetical protein